MEEALHDVTGVEVRGRWKLHLTFDDGVTGDVDVSDLKDAGPVFEPLADPEYFAKVFVDAEQGTVAWPNGASLAPERLYARASLDYAGARFAERRRRILWYRLLRRATSR